MPRPARPETLLADSVFGAVWKTVNRECFMRPKARKELLIKSLGEHFDRTENRVHCYGLCILQDRYYLSASIEGNHEPYSNWVRQAHADFAINLNARIKKHGQKRVGPVGRDRPFTSVVENDREQMRLMFAMDYAPVYAGLVEKPEDYLFSTYNLYARGIVPEWAHSFVFPTWYLALGTNMSERQKAYRRLATREHESGTLVLKLRELDKNKPLGSVSHRKKLQRYRQLVERCRRARLRRGRYRPSVPSPQEELAYTHGMARGRRVTAAIAGTAAASGP